jgi:hypothetical protein
MISTIASIKRRETLSAMRDQHSRKGLVTMKDQNPSDLFSPGITYSDRR